MPGKEWIIPLEKKNKEILLIFLRAPELGRVKTRLARDVGDEAALALYKEFVKKSLTAASAWADSSAADPDQTGSRETWIAYYPENKKELLENWLGRNHVFLAQSGSDLGQRMAGAMTKAFDHGAEKAVIVGTDIPGVRGDHIKNAFHSLNSSPVVLGPSFDGGYWLIGASRKGFTSRLFNDVDWGSPSVFSHTLDRCRDNHLAWTELATLRDVDTLADLEDIVEVP